MLENHVAHIDFIKFQKRELPHCHILMWISNEDKFRTSDYIDEVVSVEIPDKSDFEIFNIVTTKMIHGPCNVCLVDGKCSKEFPKEFTDVTF